MMTNNRNDNGWLVPLEGYGPPLPRHDLWLCYGFAAVMTLIGFLAPFFGIA